MTESMNLDSADIVGGLGFDSLDTSLEEELNMYTHEEQITVNEMDMSSGVLIKDDIDEKEEVIEEQEITEEQLMEETISYDDTGMDNHNIESVMDIVDDGSNYREEDESSIAVEDNVTNVIQNDNEMFTDGVMGEEIVTNEQVIIDSEPHIYEDTASSDKDFQDINDVMSDNMMNDDSNIVSEETVVDSENMECEQTDGEKKPLHEVVSSNVYVVPHSLSSQSYIQTTGSNTSKETVNIIPLKIINFTGVLLTPTTNINCLLLHYCLCVEFGLKIIDHFSSLNYFVMVWIQRTKWSASNV